MELSVQNLVQVLAESGAIENKQEQAQAEAQLRQWETQPAYHYLLQSVYLDVSVPLQTRWLAVICFKNGLDKYWRESRRNSIAKEEKAEIRKRIFDLIDEQNNQLTIQNAHSIARMSRFDFPGEWATLFEDFERLLTKSYQEQQVVRLNNLLLILNQVVKMLASVKIGRIGPSLLAKLPGLTPVLVKLYKSCFDTWTAGTVDLTSMQVGYLCLKTLRRVVLVGYEYPHRNETVREFFQLTVVHLKKLIVVYDQNPLEILSKYLKCYNKIYLNFTYKSPVAFVLVPASEEILLTHLQILKDKADAIYNSEEDDFWQAFAVQIFKILKELLKFVRSSDGPAQLKRPTDRDEMETAFNITQAKIFNNGNITQLVMLLLQWYLKLRPVDLESWTVEPEEWVNEQNSLSWEYQLRPCCENFCQDLTYTYPDTAARLVFEQISQNLLSTKDILSKDALLAAYQFSETPPDQATSERERLFLQTFLPEALKNDPSENKILKRRVLLIIGNRISFNNFDEGLSASYKLFVEFLQSNDAANDVVVKLTTCQVLKKLIDSYVFTKEGFKPFLNDYLAASLQLLSRVELSETQSFVIDLLSSVIMETSSMVPQQTLLDLLAMVPGAWDSSNDSTDIVLKQTLIRLLTTLVNALRDGSPKSHSITIPLLSACCDEKSEYFRLLAEDGFDLWNALVVQFPFGSTEFPSELAELFPLLLEGIMNSTEILATLMRTIRGYALVQPQLVLGSLQYFETCSSYLGSFRDDILLIFISTLEILTIKSDNEHQWSVLVESKFFERLLQYLVDDAKCSVAESNRCIQIIARIARRYPSLAVSMCGSQDNFNRFLQLWISRISTNASARDKKVLYLGLISVFQLILPQANNSIFYLEQFTLFVVSITQFLEELNEKANGDCEAYQIGYLYDEYNYSFDETITGTAEFKRVTQMYEQMDPVHNIRTKTLLKEWLLQFQTADPSTFENIMTSCLDTATFDQLKLVMSSD